jgi:hypothetical protein
MGTPNTRSFDAEPQRRSRGGHGRDAGSRRDTDRSGPGWWTLRCRPGSVRRAGCRGRGAGEVASAGAGRADRRRRAGAGGQDGVGAEVGSGAVGGDAGDGYLGPDERATATDEASLVSGRRGRPVRSRSALAMWGSRVLMAATTQTEGRHSTPRARPAQARPASRRHPIVQLGDPSQGAGERRKGSTHGVLHPAPP